MYICSLIQRHMKNDNDSREGDDPGVDNGTPPVGRSDSTSDDIPRDDETGRDSLRIEFVKYQPFINAISDSRSIIRTAGLIALVVCLIFCGLLLLAISLKRIYPYSDIQTNVQGATTIRDEEKDVTYWLFNTADLWANSGISVKKGDVLSLRASGMSHTAIHSLVKDATDNRVPSTKWIGTDGVLNREDPRDIVRNKWRIVPQKPQDALVMRIVEDEAYSSDDDRIGNTQKQSNIYLIGKGRESLQINEDGFLQFAINDIVLTDEVIYLMLRDHARMLISRYRPGELAAFDSSYSEEYTPENYQRLLKNQTAAELYLKYNNSPDNPESYKFGPYPADDVNEAVNRWDKNEMTYYMEKKYRNAWFDDNIGSFLIVIERRHQ